MLNVRRAVTVLFSLKMEAVDLSLLQWSAEMTRGLQGAASNMLALQVFC
jgi:hypothetical protein